MVTVMKMRWQRVVIMSTAAMMLVIKIRTTTIKRIAVMMKLIVMKLVMMMMMIMRMMRKRVLISVLVMIRILVAIGMLRIWLRLMADDEAASLAGSEDTRLNTECNSDPVCPPKCRCEAGVVDCSNLRLTKIPEHVPTSTTEL